MKNLFIIVFLIEKKYRSTKYSEQNLIFIVNIFIKPKSIMTNQLEKPFSLGRKCKSCKSDIRAVIYKDEDGYFIREECDCQKHNFPPRTKACDLPEYREELRTRIASELQLLKALDRFI